VDLGYRKVLNPQDLHTISEELSSDHIRNAYQVAWKRRAKVSGGRGAIYGTIWDVQKNDLMLSAIPRLLALATTLAQPFLITSMITFIQNAGDPRTQNNGYGLIAAFFLNYATMAVCNSWYQQSLSKFATKLRAGLVSLIYRHTIQIDPKDADVGAGTVLMNVDVEKVMQGSLLVHEFWTLLPNSGTALYILWGHIGVAFIPPIVASIIMAVVSYHIGTKMRPRQSQWTGATQKRVTAISYITGHMKAIKMLGLSRTVEDDISRLREEEVLKQQYVQIVLPKAVTKLTSKGPSAVYLLSSLQSRIALSRSRPL
jgi:ATP-binding cassette subfamily C (CFTR/MRP) protein 1